MYRMSDRIFLFVLTALFLVPGVLAVVSVDPLTITQYNAGDTLSVSGQVSHTAAVRGYLMLEMVCSNTTTPISTTLFDLSANVPQSYSQLFTLPDGSSGSCFVRATLRDNAFIFLSSAQSSSFVISSDLRGTFTSSGTSFQLGDTFTLQGDITQLDGSAVDGTAVLTYRRSDVAVLTQSTSVVDGLLDHVFSLRLLPTGSYAVDVVVTDSRGNSQSFAAVASFTLEDQLLVFLDLVRDSYLPGETVTVSGEVETKAGGVPSDLVLDVTLDSRVEHVLAQGGSFTYQFLIPFSAKAISYTVDLLAKDADGNIGSATTHYSVVQVPTTLRVELAATSVEPGAQLSFEPVFLDQAGDLYDTTVTVMLLNPNTQQVLSTVVSSNEDHTLGFEQFALPGPWQLQVDGEGLHDEVQVTVVPKRALETSLSGVELSIHNIGNVAWDDVVQMKANDLFAEEQVSLAVNASTTWDLREYFADGNYTLVISTTGEQYENVELFTPGIFSRFASGFKKVFGKDAAAATGSAVVETETTSSPALASSSLFSLLAFVALAGLVFFFYRRQVGKSSHDESYPLYSPDTYNKEERSRDLVEGQARRVQLEREKVDRKPRYEYGKATEEDIKDFRKQMERKFAEEQQDQQRNSFQRQNPPPSSGSVFDMFN